MQEASPLSGEALRRALIQHLRTDQLFGVREVPVPPITWHHAPHEACATETVKAENPHDPGLRGAREADLRVIDEKEVKACRKCGLHQTRTNTVFGQGDPCARLVFVGEAPGFDEDQQGLAFVGRAGQLLTRMIQAMGLKREEVFICNVLKCRPPENRDPEAEEIVACSPYLRRQLAIIRPEVIVALGAPAAKTLLRTAESIGRLRGRFHDFHLEEGLSQSEPIPVMPTYHPAYLLRNPEQKSKAWQDLQAVMRHLGLPVPAGPS